MGWTNSDARASGVLPCGWGAARVLRRQLRVDVPEAQGPVPVGEEFAVNL